MSAIPHRLTHHKYRKVISYAFLIVSIAFVIVHWADRIVPEIVRHKTTPGGFLDFDCYAEASRRLCVGEPIYSSTEEVLHPRHSCVAHDLPEYVYTPFLAVVLLPFAGIDHCLFEILWLVMNVVFLCVLVPLTITGLELPKSPYVFAIAILLFGSLVATLETITLGQINFVVLLMMMIAVISFNRGGVWWCLVDFGSLRDGMRSQNRSGCVRRCFSEVEPVIPAQGCAYPGRVYHV